MARIAISYRRSDTQAMTGRIFDRLVDRYGDDSVFMDIDKIPFGFDFRDQIREVLEQSDIVLAVIGLDWTGQLGGGTNRLAEETDPVRFEMETALGLKKPVIPVLVNDASMPKAGDLPESLRQFVYFNAAEIDAGRDFRVHMDRLMKAMDQILARQAPPPAKEAEPPAPPAPVAAREPDPIPGPAPVPAAVRVPEPDPPPAIQARPEPPAPPAPQSVAPAQADPSARLLRPMAALREAAEAPAPPPRAMEAARPPAAPVPEFAASIDWRGLADLLVHALVAAGISVALFYGTGASGNSSAGPFFAFGTLFLLVVAGAILYWRRRDLGGKALAVGALAAVVILSIIYPGADPSTARAFAYFGPLAMIGTLTTFQLAVIIAILALLAAVGNIAAQFVTRFRRGREGPDGQVVGLLTRAPRKPLLAPLAPASGQRRTVVIACLVAVPTLILVSAQLTNAMSENEYRAQNYVIASAVIGLLAGFLAARLAGILGLGAIVLGVAIGLLANVLTWIGQSILAAVTDGAFAWDTLNGPFYFGRDFARYETTLYYAVAMALAVLAGNLLAQGAQIYLGADTARRRGFIAALTIHPIAATLAGFLLAAAGSYIAFRFAIYPYCVGHTPLTLPGLCST